jgi:hypothetical protein
MESSVKYHEAALSYLDNYYHSFADESFYFGYPFINGLIEEGTKIAKAENLRGMEYENALMAVCFRFAGVTDILTEDETRFKLLHDFAKQINYPLADLELVENVIRKNINFSNPVTAVERVVWDTIAYRFAIDDLIIHVSFLKEEINRINDASYSELEILTKLKGQFLRSLFVTSYAKEKFKEKRDKNFSRLDKRIQKLSQSEKKPAKDSAKQSASFSDKETEDLFKIAFRNYVHLVSVADSKAGLLINVNSIIISVVIAFVVSRSEKYPILIIPAFILLSVAFTTILLSILASRPQRSNFIQDKSSKSYQTFFFGSFDLVGNEFSKADWNTYSVELDGLLKGGRELIYDEMYKEAFNVRKVLGKKFTYLSFAYLVFIIGLFISIVSFFITSYNG